MILGHFALAASAKKKPAADTPWPWLFFAFYGPDLLDKPARMLFGMPGRGFGHTLIFFALVATLLALLRALPPLRRRPLLYPALPLGILALGWASHLVGDTISPQVLFWPLMGPLPEAPPMPLWELLAHYAEFYLLPSLRFQFILDISCLALALWLWLPRRRPCPADRAEPTSNQVDQHP